MKPDKSARRTILIAATHRSGSYLACDWLSQLGGIPFAEEYFNFNLLAARQELRLSDDMARSDVLNHLMVHHRSDQGVFAVKAMWPAFESLFTEMFLDSEKLDSNAFEFALRLLEQPQFLFVRRRDKAKQAVSFEKAKQQGVWRSEKRDGALDDTLVYSAPRILDCWNQIHGDEAGWLAFFRQYNLPYFEIWYEDMVADPMRVVGDALRFLGLETNTDAVIQSRYDKLSSGLNLEWKTRFLNRHKEVYDPSPEAAIAARIDCSHSPSARMAPDTASVLKCDIMNLGSADWVPSVDQKGQANFGVELRTVAPDGAYTEKVLWRTELYDRVKPGDCEVLPLRLEVGLPSEDIRCKFVFCHPQGELPSEGVISVKLELDEKWEFLRRVFTDLSESDLTGWVKVPALGDIWVDSFPFIYQREHGWLNADIENSSPGIFCALDFELDYFAVHLSDPRVYHIFKDGDPKRYVFKGVVDGQREFIKAGSGSVLRCDLSHHPEN